MSTALGDPTEVELWQRSTKQPIIVRHVRHCSKLRRAWEHLNLNPGLIGREGEHATNRLRLSQATLGFVSPQSTRE